MFRSGMPLPEVRSIEWTETSLSVLPFLWYELASVH